MRMAGNYLKTFFLLFAAASVLLFCTITATAVVLFFFIVCLIARCLAGLAFGCAGLFHKG